MPKKPKSKTRANKETVFTVVDDLVANLLINDRESDEDLPAGEIEKLIAKEVLSVDDIVEKFRESLEEHLEDLESNSEKEEEDDEEDELDLDEDEDDD